MIAFYYDIENVEIGDRSKLNEKELEKIAIKNNLNISFISCGFLNLLDVIDRLNMPVVVKLNSEFIVVKGYDLEKKELYILDANDAGATFVDFESFNKAWSSQGNLMIVIRSAS
jgi:ABC-type bacteriocin/lantibiotic exporter with double-glycine peptidase domain